MTVRQSSEERALDQQERALVASSQHPAVQALSDAELAELRARLRERRDRAQRLARQRRRELRGKAAPRGASPSRDDSGSARKSELLAGAVRRVNAESQRRSRLQARLALIESQQRAFALRHEKPHQGPDFNSRTASDGMRRKDNRKVARIGSAMEAGRVSQATKVAQAKKDAR